MKQFALVILVLLIPFKSTAHPLHLSITNITYENGKLNIRIKSFRDDWEVGYFHFHSKPIDFSVPENRDIPWFSDYLNANFRITTEKGGPPLAMETDSVFLEDVSMTIEMHAVVPINPNSLYIYDALLIDIFPDQSNLVIFVYGKKETGIKFDVKKQDAEVILR
jgi:Domain of unknown function (DUF6702)